MITFPRVIFSYPFAKKYIVVFLCNSDKYAVILIIGCRNNTEMRTEYFPTLLTDPKGMHNYRMTRF